MCGITGWVDFERNLSENTAIVKQMNNTLLHRGPDAEGYYSSQHALLGHRRLIVIDPAGGKQPMTRQWNNNQYTITYNGELYNTFDLRKELESRGHIFQTHNSDTEVLLLSYIEWGRESLKKINGILAFAIWDHKHQQLFMARDRMGVKPLFYRYYGKGIIFASEPKAILTHPEVKAEIDKEGLAEILGMGPARTPGNGIFKGIQELRPGYYLAFNRKGIRIEQYWSLKSCEHTDDYTTTVLRVKELFADSVKRQLVADRPVCSLLSGGLDSSAITAVAASAYRKNGIGPLKTFSVDYLDNQKYYTSNSFEVSSDNPWIKRVSDYCKTLHNNVMLDNSELAQALYPALMAADLPGMTDIDSSLLLFCRDIREEATVALSGECADEIFGGYPWFRETGITTFPWIRMVEEKSAFLLPHIKQMIKPDEYVQERYREALAEVPGLANEDMQDAQMRQLFYLNITRFMPVLLDRKDRMSMACSLEVRVPFADHRLVEYVWNIPADMKFQNGLGKGILRKALAGILPADVINRSKSPYPRTHNPEYAAAVTKELISDLKDPNAPVHDILDVSRLLELIAKGEGLFVKPFFGQLMGDVQFLAYVLQFNRWLKAYKVNIAI